MSVNLAVSCKSGGSNASRQAGTEAMEWVVVGEGSIFQAMDISGRLDDSVLAVVPGRSADPRLSPRAGLIDHAADTSTFPGGW